MRSLADAEPVENRVQHIVRRARAGDFFQSASRLAEIGEAWQRIIGRHYPAMALVEVVRLVEPQAMVEIEATAVVEE